MRSFRILDFVVVVVVAVEKYGNLRGNFLETKKAPEQATTKQTKNSIDV